MSEAYDRYKWILFTEKLERPKPSITIKCIHCGTSKKPQQLSTVSAADFFWRYYKCKSCRCNFWSGVSLKDNQTVLTANTPRITSLSDGTLLTGNLRFILPAGHPAVTSEYDQFAPGGKLRDDTPVREAQEPQPSTVEQPTLDTSNDQTQDDVNRFAPNEVTSQSYSPEEMEDMLEFARWEEGEKLKKQFDETATILDEEGELILQDTHPEKWEQLRNALVEELIKLKENQNDRKNRVDQDQTRDLD